MGTRGRPKATIKLTTGNDPSLYQYASLEEALRKNVSFIASLIDPKLLMKDCPDDDPAPIPASDIQPTPSKKRKPRKQ